MAKEIADFMKITPNIQRIDGLIVAANIQNLSLLEIFYTCVVDGAYSSELNTTQEELHQMKLITTNFTGRKLDDIYVDFKFTKDGHYLMKCINGATLEQCTYDERND